MNEHIPTMMSRDTFVLQPLGALVLLILFHFFILCGPFFFLFYFLKYVMMTSDSRPTIRKCVLFFIFF